MAHFSKGWLLWGAVLVVSALACGEESKPDNRGEEVPERSSGAGGSAGENSTGGSTAAGGSASTDSNGGSTTSSNGGTGGSPSLSGPKVEVLYPDDQSAPDQVFNLTLDARCRVEQSEDERSAPPDVSTITIDLFDEDDQLLVSEVALEGEDADVYEATFQVQNVSAGPVTVRCSAADSSLEPRTSSDEVVTHIDHGPLVNIISPEEEASESAIGPVVFEYVVLPNELAMDDEGAAVDDVQLTVKGLPFEITPVLDDENTFRTTIDFTDSNIFAEVPEGSVSVALSASNARGITHVERYDFLLDSTGPALSIDSPSNGAVVGGTVNMNMSVPDDGSGVDLDTLVVELNDQEFPYDPEGPWSHDGDSVTFQFESASVEGSIVQLNVNVRVRDNAGNPADGASALYYKDEYAPIVMLEAPLFRGRNMNTDTCSHSFNPLGHVAKHGDLVNNTARFRALVWDLTNSAGGGTLYFSTTDQDRVRLFARPADEPLVADTTGDGVCDDIHDEQAVPFQKLIALRPTGSPWFGPEELDPFSNPPMGECTYGSSSEPNLLCAGYSDLLTVANHNISGGEEPVVYAIAPTDSGPDCTGRAWELPSAIPGYEGWVCLAARAHDRVGNRGISKPMAVCLDNSTIEGAPSCAPEPREPPSCRSDCEDPPALPATGVIYNR